MRKVTMLVSLIAVLGIGVTSAQAQKYGMAGCGLGALVFEDDPSRFSQVLASTTNGTFGSQTFGITSATSECNPAGPGKRAAVFVEVNREALAKDVARGGGETVDNLSAIMGCSDPKAVGAVLQQNFKVIFPEQGVSNDRVTDAILQTMKQEKALVGTCTNLT